MTVLGYVLCIGENARGAALMGGAAAPAHYVMYPL